MHSYTDPPSKDGVPDIPLSRLKCRIPVQGLKVATISDGRLFIVGTSAMACDQGKIFACGRA